MASEKQISSTSTYHDSTGDNLPRPIVIGIYGVSGCGKSTLVKELQARLGKDQFVFFDGSSAIDIVFPEDIEAFKLIDESAKTYWRRMAIHNIRTICQREGKIGIIAGHYMFWDCHNSDPDVVWTDGDKNSYTHILYLDRHVDVVARQRATDTSRVRQKCSLEHLDRWQQREKCKLRRECLQAGVIFALLPPTLTDDLVAYAEALVRDFEGHDKEVNLERVQAKFDETFDSRKAEIQTMLVLDGDKTLITEDTGKLFWEACDLDPFQDGRDPLKTIYGSQTEYVHSMFRQATLLYEEVGDIEFDAICSNVASTLTIRPDFKKLLQSAAQENHVGAVVVTAGLSSIFVKLLEQEGLSDSVEVIGSGRVDNGFVITGEVKASLVRHIRRKLGARIYAFGDSELDLGMLMEADEAIVVVDDIGKRSKSMEAKLCERIAQGWPYSSKLWQMLTSSIVTSPLQVDCPRFDLTPSSLSTILAPPIPRPKTPKVIHATEKPAAKLFMTPMRDASLRGPALRQAHHAVGKYLAAEYVSQVVGIETYEIPHVQGKLTEGYRMRGEAQALIVALMRGGEPMALGVSEMLPTAMFLHAKDPGELIEENVRGRHTIILVDSVINSGKSVVEFLTRIRSLHGKIHIVIVAGVVQEKATITGALADLVAADPNVNLVALRLSANKYTGRGGTDTGHRLFNTTHL